MVQILPAFIFASLFFTVAPGTLALPRPVATRQITAFPPIGTKQPKFPNPGIGTLNTRQNENGGGSNTAKNGGGDQGDQDPNGGGGSNTAKNGGG